MSTTALPDAVRLLLDLPPEGSTFAAEVDALHAAVIGTTMLGAVAVAGIAYLWIVRYGRRSPGELTPRVQAPLALEIGMAGATLTLFIAFWVVGFRQYVSLQDPPPDAATVYVSAKQWMWEFQYTNGRATNDVLVVPAGKAVRLIMTSRDVIHSFYVPSFRTKQDVIPGRYTTIWFRADAPGRYPIRCAEYCGMQHSEMRGEVAVLGPEDYAHWLDGDAPGTESPRDLAEVGREVAEHHECLACHSITGERHVGPTFSRLYGSIQILSDGRRVKADEQYLTRSMMEPGVEIVAGYANVMPPAYRTSLSQPDVGALVEFIKSLRDGPSAPPASLPPIAVIADGGVVAATPSPITVTPP
jgi:cytochrome c oxidase subunit 2